MDTSTGNNGAGVAPDTQAGNETYSWAWVHSRALLLVPGRQPSALSVPLELVLDETGAAAAALRALNTPWWRAERQRQAVPA